MTIRRNTPAFVAGKQSDVVLLTETDGTAERGGGGGGEGGGGLAPPAAKTVNLEPAVHGGKYDVQATVDGKIITLVISLVTVKEDQTP